MEDLRPFFICEGNMNIKVIYKRIRITLGILGAVLPFLALGTAAMSPIKQSGWWHSLSATYFLSPVLTGVLSAVALFLICYDGYEFKDSVICGIAGYAALIVVIFPCKGEWMPATEAVGIFNIPAGVSTIIHFIAACVLFIAMGINSAFFFTIGENNPTKEKKKRNIIYKVCGFGMIGVLTIVGIPVMLLGIEWGVIAIESVMLWLFGLSWLTKSGVIYPDGGSV